jgi:hypothetical protein
MAKPGPALFELLRDPSIGARTATPRPGNPVNTEAPVVATRPVPIPTVTPEISKPRVRLPVASETPAPAPKAAAAPASVEAPKLASPVLGQGVKFPLRKPVTISTSGLVLGGVGVLVLALIVGIWAYSAGSKDGEAKTLSDKRLAGGVSDPLKAEQIPVNGGLVSPESGNRVASVKPVVRPPVPEPRTSVAPAPQPGDFSSGLNYCIAAARIEKDLAERAAGYLRDNGVPAAAVQVVDGQWSGANNPGSWMVVVLKGITGKEYGARDRARLDIEDQLTKLGQVYKSDPTGRIDFGQFAWYKRK